ncbi:HAD family hydrolase [Amylibacter sp.]|nr:HAD family hydrolase [Amylibacter sp.]
MKIDVSKTVFVFDLDDTLYMEYDYHKSGVCALVTKINELFPATKKNKLEEIIMGNNEDFLGEICKYLNLPVTFKESLLWEYRLHTPNISLLKEVHDLLDFLLNKSLGVSIITDGRILTQKKKLSALGLEHIPVYISEEYGAEKPDLERFKKVSSQFSNCQFVYLGDNPKKDFIAPNLLNWITVGVRASVKNIHSQDLMGLDNSCLPNIWIKRIEDLKDYLC